MLARAEPQALAQLFRALWNVGQALKQGAQIQAGADSENRKARARPQIGENGESHLSITARGRGFFRSEYVNQVMRNSAAFCHSRFGRADVKATIELRGVAGHYFAAEFFRQPNR